MSSKIAWAISWTAWASIELANTKLFGDWLSTGTGDDENWPVCNFFYDLGCTLYDYSDALTTLKSKDQNNV